MIYDNLGYVDSQVLVVNSCGDKFWEGRYW